LHESVGLAPRESARRAVHFRGIELPGTVESWN
jgi:hypothetical protein